MLQSLDNKTHPELMFHLLLVVHVLLQMQQSISQTISCNNASQCAGQDITSNDTIECYGYGSCLNAVHIESNQGTINNCSICCLGSYSCYNATTIQRNGTTNGQIWCNGLFSCAFVSDLYNEKGVVSCQGEQSCRGSKMTLDDAASINEDHLQCWGDRSCMDANITTRNGTTLWGHLSGLNSVFYSDNITVKYEFGGSNSGYNSTIICGIEQTCTVFCYGNGCNTLTLLCSDGVNTSCIFNIDCSHAEKSDNNNVCPNGMCIYGTIINNQ